MLVLAPGAHSCTHGALCRTWASRFPLTPSLPVRTCPRPPHPRGWAAVGLVRLGPIDRLSAKPALVHALLLLRLEQVEAWQELVPVDHVRVELGAVDARVLSHRLALDLDRHHAGATHAGGIHHDRVEAVDTPDAVRLAEVAHRPHHERW